MAENRIKILAIDDKPDNLTVLKAVVADALPGAEVFTAGGGQQGLELALAENPDVILLDIVMPQMDGYEVCRRLKADARLKLIPVVFLTAIKTNKESRIKALEAGGEGFLPKPLEEAELLAQIRAMVKIKAGNVALLAEQERLNLELDERTHTLANESWEHQRTKKGRESAEAALRHSEHRFKALFEQAPLGYQALDENGNFLEVNATWCETLGYTKPEVIGKWFGDFLAPEYVEAFRQRFPVFKSEGKIHSEFSMLHKDGSRRFIAFEGRIGYKPDGSFQQTHCILKDITAQKAAEDEVKRTEENYRLLTENSPDLIARFDKGLRHIYVNPAAAAVGKQSAAQYIGKTMRETGVPVEEALKWEKLIRGVFLTGCGTDIEDEFDTPDGKRYFVTRFVPEKSADGAVNSVIYFARDITGRLAAEETLSDIIEKNPMSIQIVDRDGFTLKTNPAHIALFGSVPPAGFSIFEDLQSRSKELGPLIARARSGEAVSLPDIYFNAHDLFSELPDKPVWVHATIFPLKGSDGQQERFVLMHEDITERKVAEEALVQSQNLLKETELIGKVGGWSFNIDTMQQVWTEEVYRIHEVEITSDPSVDEGINYYTPESRPIIEGAVQRAIEHGEGFDLELEIITAKNNRRWVHTIGRADLANRRINGFFQDINERKAAEGQLRQKTAILEAALSSMRDAVFISDTAGRFIEFNDAFATFHKFRDKSECAKQLSDYPDFLEVYLPDGELAPLEMWAVPRALRGETVANAEYKLRRKDTGEAWEGSYSFSPVRDEKGAIIGSVVLGRDITEIKRTQEEAERLRNELQQSQKIESVGRLAGGVAHDFNNLLTAIGGYAGFLMRGLSKEDPKQEDVKEILAATERAAGLTKQLLAFSRKQILNPQVVDLNASVAGVVKMLKRLIGEEVQIQTKFAAQGCRTRVDPGQIDQVLVNLAVNARDAMPKGGVLTLETEILTPDANFSLRHPDLPQGPLMCLTVRDTGSGLTAEARQHMFEPFFTTKEKGKGTGLGLSTVFGIVKQSGGEIEVESEPDSGTAFRMYFPCVDAPVLDQKKDQDKVTLPRGSETILLVEDEDMLRRLGERILKADGYTVITAADGKAALEAVQRHGKPVDLLVTDVVMPGMSGRELALEMSKRKLAHRTLYMSGYTDEAISDHGVLEEGIAFIYKPFSPDALSKKLREVLDGPAESAKA